MHPDAGPLVRVCVPGTDWPGVDRLSARTTARVQVDGPGARKRGVHEHGSAACLHSAAPTPAPDGRIVAVGRPAAGHRDGLRRGLVPVATLRTLRGVRPPHPVHGFEHRSRARLVRRARTGSGSAAAHSGRRCGGRGLVESAAPAPAAGLGPLPGHPSGGAQQRRYARTRSGHRCTATPDPPPHAAARRPERRRGNPPGNHHAPPPDPPGDPTRGPDHHAGHGPDAHTAPSRLGHPADIGRPRWFGYAVDVVVTVR